jgi:hypothetical protein
LVAHGSQLLVSFPPVEQMACEQPVVVLTHWPLALHVEPDAQVPHDPPQPSSPQLLPVQLGVQPPPQLCPQTEATSPTQTLSHEVAQQ